MFGLHDQRLPPKDILFVLCEQNRRPRTFSNLTTKCCLPVLRQREKVTINAQPEPGYQPVIVGLDSAGLHADRHHQSVSIGDRHIGFRLHLTKPPVVDQPIAHQRQHRSGSYLAETVRVALILIYREFAARNAIAAIGIAAKIAERFGNLGIKITAIIEARETGFRRGAEHRVESGLSTEQAAFGTTQSGQRFQHLRRMKPGRRQHFGKRQRRRAARRLGATQGDCDWRRQAGSLRWRGGGCTSQPHQRRDRKAEAISHQQPVQRGPTQCLDSQPSCRLAG